MVAENSRLIAVLHFPVNEVSNIDIDDALVYAIFSPNAVSTTIIAIPARSTYTFICASVNVIVRKY